MRLKILGARASPPAGVTKEGLNGDTAGADASVPRNTACRFLRPSAPSSGRSTGRSGVPYRLVRQKNKKLSRHSPKGLSIKAQGCGTPLPWVRHSPPHYPNGVASKGLTQPFQGRGQVVAPGTQGSGVPQPWALIFNPFRIKNTPIKLQDTLFNKKTSTGLRAAPLLVYHARKKAGSKFIRPRNEVFWSITTKMRPMKCFVLIIASYLILVGAGEHPNLPHTFQPVPSR